MRTSSDGLKIAVIGLVIAFALLSLLTFFMLAGFTKLGQRVDRQDRILACIRTVSDRQVAGFNVPVEPNLRECFTPTVVNGETQK